MRKVQWVHGDLAPQRAHPGHVLLFMHGVDDRARAQEEQALGEAVGHEVEDGREPGAHAKGGEHVAQLAQRRVGQHALDVLLRQRDGGGQDGRERADGGDQQHGLGRGGEDRRGAGDEVDTGVDHGRGVDERGDRGRALHGVGQPDVERELGALAGGADEEQHGHGVADERVDLATFHSTNDPKKSIVPVSRNTPMMPMRKLWSATRLTRKAFLDARAGARRLNQKPMSR